MGWGSTVVVSPCITVLVLTVLVLTVLVLTVEVATVLVMSVAVMCSLTSPSAAWIVAGSAGMCEFSEDSSGVTSVAGTAGKCGSSEASSTSTSVAGSAVTSTMSEASCSSIGYVDVAGGVVNGRNATGGGGSARMHSPQTRLCPCVMARCLYC